MTTPRRVMALDDLEPAGRFSCPAASWSRGIDTSLDAIQEMPGNVTRMWWKSGSSGRTLLPDGGVGGGSVHDHTGRVRCVEGSYSPGLWAEGG